METLLESVKRHEGLRLFPYLDSLGFVTIGYGRCLEKKGITPQEAEYLLQNDLAECERQYSFLPEEVRENCNEQRKGILVEMVFQLGLGGVKKFERMLQALAIGYFEKAADEMLMSKWAQQTPERCKEMSEVMRRGSRT